jgi:hypothetical protein
VLFAGDGDHHFVQVPFVAAARRSSTDAVGEFPAKFQPPLPDRLKVTEMPRAASISSTMHRLNGIRKYSQTA